MIIWNSRGKKKYTVVKTETRDYVLMDCRDSLAGITQIIRNLQADVDCSMVIYEFGKIRDVRRKVTDGPIYWFPIHPKRLGNATE